MAFQNEAKLRILHFQIVWNEKNIFEVQKVCTIEYGQNWNFQQFWKHCLDFAHCTYIIYICYQLFHVKIPLYLRIPKTRYPKMMDFYEVISLILPFTEMILHSVIYFLRKKTILDKDVVKSMTDLDANHEIAIRFIKKMARYGLPMAFIVFLFGFFFIGFWSTFEDDSGFKCKWFIWIFDGTISLIITPI